MLNNFCSAQYVPIPTDSTAIWRVDYYDFQSCGLPQPNAQMQYTLIEDTSIGNNTYKKVLISGVSVCLAMGQVWGYLRNDTTAKKVYFMSIDSTSEGVLYDFNLNVGDTVPNYFGFMGQQPFIVDSIDSINLGGINRKRIHYIPDMPTIVEPYIIEGIGSLTGLISPLNGIGTAFALICFSDSNQTIFPDASASCELINSVNSVQEGVQILIKDNFLFAKNSFVNSLKIFDLNYKLLKYCDGPQMNISGLYGFYIVEVILKNNKTHRYKIVIF
jgi:hypothetical protein